MVQTETDYGVGLVKVKTPKVLVYDIECTGILGYSYGLWDTNIHKVIEQPVLLSFSWAWLDVERIAEPDYMPKIKCRTIAQTDTYKLDPKNDALLVKELYDLFSKTDVTLGHNSKQFDDKMSNMFFIKHGLNPIVPHQQLDTKLIAKQIMRLPSYSLNYISDFLKQGRKTETTHADLWWDMINGGSAGKKAAKKMATYNNQDVRLTVADFKILMPWYRSPVNFLRIANLEFACPHCLHSDYHAEGTRTTKTQRYQRYKCDNCHSWFSDNSAIKKKDGDIKPAVSS